MKLRHTTPRHNLPSIKRRGLDPSFSQGKREDLWFHTESKTLWAILHVMRRHQTLNVITIDVQVPRSWLTRRPRGLWTCSRPITPDRIIGQHETSEFTNGENHETPI